jgi:nucleoside-diphosphate-sugar epimerase
LPIARLQQNLPVLTVAEAPFTNRIHADDLAMICKIAMQNSASGEVYNTCDDQPSTMTDYFNAVADYAELPRPPQVSREKANEVMSVGMLSYLKESRKIHNKKLIETLGIKLRYPTLADALKK